MSIKSLAYLGTWNPNHITHVLVQYELLLDLS